MPTAYTNQVNFRAYYILHIKDAPYFTILNNLQENSSPAKHVMPRQESFIFKILKKKIQFYLIDVNIMLYIALRMIKRYKD